MSEPRVKHKQIRVAVHGHAPTPTLTEVKVRGHSFVIDEPPYRHGTDVGPTPLETLLGALVGCTNVIASRIAAEKRIDFRFDRIDVVGMLDHRGIDMQADVPVPFPSIDLVVTARTKAGPEAIGALRAELARRCPVSVILRQAGSAINETWNVTYE